MSEEWAAKHRALERVAELESANVALRTENERLRKAVEAAKRAKDLLLSEFEHRAEQSAIRAGLGVGEWESFMPKAWYELDAAIAALDQGEQLISKQRSREE